MTVTLPVVTRGRGKGGGVAEPGHGCSRPREGHDSPAVPPRELFYPLRLPLPRPGSGARAIPASPSPAPAPAKASRLTRRARASLTAVDQLESSPALCSSLATVAVEISARRASPS